MKVWIDCEWNEFGGDLISVALVAEDGSEFYEVLPCPNPGQWVSQHVMPILGKEAIGLDVFGIKLQQFLARFQSVHLIADWPEDIAWFCRLLIVGPGMRMNTPDLMMQIVRVDAKSEIPHNALADARALKEATK